MARLYTMLLSLVLIPLDAWCCSTTRRPRSSHAWTKASSSRPGGPWITGLYSRCLCRCHRHHADRPALRPSLSTAAILLLTCVCYANAGALTDQSPTDQLKTLLAEKHWPKILEITGESASTSPESLYYRGIALAAVGRLTEAETALETGLSRTSADHAPFLVELAGVRFKQGRLPEARAAMRQAMSLGYADDYAFDFLGTLHFLDGNLPAALKYWNRIGKPRIRDITIYPPEILDPVILDRLTPFSTGTILRLN